MAHRFRGGGAESLSSRHTSAPCRVVANGISVGEEWGTGTKPSPSGAMGCSHGWSESASSGRPEPVVLSRGFLPRPGRGEGSVWMRPMALRTSAPAGDVIGFGHSIPQVPSASGGLHPWQQPSGPSGTKAVTLLRGSATALKPPKLSRTHRTTASDGASVPHPSRKAKDGAPSRESWSYMSSSQQAAK